MDDTAQPAMAAETDDPNVQLANAAEAFKDFENPVAGRKRDETGKFAAEEQPDEETEDEPEAEAAEGEDEVEEDTEDDEEAAEEAQPLPPSWKAEDAELWGSLPPEAQARIAEREGERDRGLNLKLQESANERKQAQLAAKEAQTKREEYLAALETVEGLYAVPKPDPRAFGYGTPQYNAGAYATALAEYETNAQALAQFREQRESLAKQAREEAEKEFAEWKQQHEAQFAPKLLAKVPELKDPAKGEPMLRELFSYAVEAGIPEENFAEASLPEITSAQLLILWKAQQFDKLEAGSKPPQPKKAGPAVKPGVSSPRSAQKATQRQRAFDRLDREGSLEAAAALFKQM